jgi:hypothetical protein
VQASVQLLNLFGVTSNVTIFLLFLGIIGFFIHYSNERRTEQLIALALIPCALFFEHGALIIAAFLAVYGSRALHYLDERKWNFAELRPLTMTLIACGILFTTVSVERELMQEQPDRHEVVRFVSAAYPQGINIAAPKDITPLLAYAGYPAYTDTLPADKSELLGRIEEQHYTLYVTEVPRAQLNNFPIVYKSGQYIIYEVRT